MVKVNHLESKAVADFMFRKMNAFSRLVQHSNVVPAGLTQQQVKIIMELSTTGAVRLSDLSRCAAVTHGTMTVAVQKLLKKDLLVRKKDPKDERAVRLDLSVKGRAVAQQIHQKTVEMFDQVCAHLNASQRKKLVESYKFLFETYKSIVQKKGF